MKNKIRKESLIKRKKLNKNIASKKIVEEILKSNILDKYTNIGIYYPINNEIDITDLLLFYPDKNFYLPITNNNLKFSKYKLNDKLVLGKFNTMEPQGEIVQRDTIECFLIPCVGITKFNQRLGYGKGYYDRYLSDYKGMKIGVCYKELINLDLEFCNYDIVLDLIFSG